MRLGIFSLLFIVFALWVVIAPGGEQRIIRTCEPVNWVGSLSVSIGQLIFPEHQDSVQDFFDRSNYSCRFVVWRLIYEDRYLEEGAINE